jgi:outer membrane protein TolC
VIENNPDNRIYQLQKEQADRDKKVANSYLYPKINGGLSGQYNMSIAETPIPGEIFGRPGEVEYVKFGLPYTYTGGITISKTVFDWQSRFQSKIAETNSDLVNAEKSLFEQSLKEQSAQLYYAILLAYEAIEIAEKDLILADSILSIATERFEQGLIDKLTFNQAKLSKNNAIDKLEQNKQYCYENVINLKVLLGLTPSDELILGEQLALERTIQPMVQVIPNESNLDLYKLQSEIASYDKKMALSQFSPKVDLVYYWGGIQYQEDLSFSLNSKGWQPNSYLGITVSLPLFTGFANKNQYKSASIAHRIAELNYMEEIRKSSMNDSIMANNLLSSRNMAIIANDNLKISDENVRMAYKRYSEGLISLDMYLGVYDDYLDVENLYFSRASDYMINKARIDSRNKY